MPTENKMKTLAIMSVHERRLSHDVIDLRNEQDKLHASIEALKLEVAQQKRGRRDIPPLPLRGGPEAALSVHASPEMSPILKVPQVSVTENMSDVFASEVNTAFETLGDEITRLRLRLGMHLENTPRGNDWEVSGTTSGVPDREHDQPVDLEALRQEVRQIKEENAGKFDSLSQRLEKIHVDVSLLALESGRIALRAGEMGHDDRTALLGILESREAAISRSGNVTPRSVDSLTSMNSTARSTGTMNKFKSMIMTLGNIDPRSGDATPATPATPVLSVDFSALRRDYTRPP